jgi:hypothetical protein
VGFREEALPELPDVDYITVQDKDPGLDAFQVGEKFPGMASDRPEVDIGNHHDVDFPFRKIPVHGAKLAVLKSRNEGNIRIHEQLMIP